MNAQNDPLPFACHPISWELSQEVYCADKNWVVAGTRSILSKFVAPFPNDLRDNLFATANYTRPLPQQGLKSSS